MAPAPTHRFPALFPRRLGKGGNPSCIPGIELPLPVNELLIANATCMFPPSLFFGTSCLGFSLLSLSRGSLPSRDQLGGRFFPRLVQRLERLGHSVPKSLPYLTLFVAAVPVTHQVIHISTFILTGCSCYNTFLEHSNADTSRPREVSATTCNIVKLVHTGFLYWNKFLAVPKLLCCLQQLSGVPYTEK